MRALADPGVRYCPKCGKDLTTPQPEHHLPPGTVVGGKYMLGAALGEGGFGITYVGKDTKLDLLVAVKEFYPYGFVNRSASISPTVLCSTNDEKLEFFEKGRARFLQEAQMLARFSGDPGIVDVRDFFEENNTAYIVMEFLEGETLKKRLERTGPLPAEEALRLLTPVMRSLSRLHRENLIHRDVSPDNIMLAKNGVKLLDFGAARFVEDGNQKSLSVVLKHGYAPYEQYQTHGNQGPWTDVYALCATLYKCMTGIRIPGATDRLLDDRLQLPSAMGVQIDPRTEQALLKGLAVRPKDRWQSMDELLGALQTDHTEKGNTDRKTQPPVDDEKTENEADRDLTRPPDPDYKQTDHKNKEQKKKKQNEDSGKKPRVIVLTSVAAVLLALVLIGLIKNAADNRRKTILNDPGAAEDNGAGQAASAVTYSMGDVISFGSYPQSKVTDEATLSALEAAEKEWKSYRYYTGTGHKVDGNMAPGDWMRYADITYNGEKYRAVTFDNYRPDYTGDTPSETTASQDENGYAPGRIYYFRFEALQWRVLDPSAGLVMCEDIVDAQPFQNTVYYDSSLQLDRAYFHNSDEETFVCDYEKSSLRLWLNETFFDTAFSAAEQGIITVTRLDNSAYSTKYSFLDGAYTNDRVFLLSYEDLLNPDYGFPSDRSEESESRRAIGSDYAKNQGLIISEETECSTWLLRSPGDSSDGGTDVFRTGRVLSFGAGLSSNCGIRPALCLSENVS